MDDQVFDVILADPAWDYKSRAAWSKTRFGGGARKHYPVMTTDQLCRLPIAKMAAKRSVCLMWATFPKLKDAIRVLEAWGFKYTTVAFVWVKMCAPKLVRTWHGQKLTTAVPLQAKPWGGPGYYTRSNCEIVLLGTKGRPLAPASKAVQQVVMEPHAREWRTNKAGKRYSAIIHSRKPDTIRKRIEQLFGPVRRVELFAREEVPGWVPIGDQLPNGTRLEPVEPDAQATPPKARQKATRSAVDPAQPVRQVPGQLVLLPELAEVVR